AFPTSGSQVPNELLIFSVQDGRWTHDDVNVEFLFSSPAEPFTVDNFKDLFPSDDLDDPDIDPDDIDSAVFDDRRTRLAAFRTNHRMGLFTGPARPAVIDTKEFELISGGRA